MLDSTGAVLSVSEYEPTLGTVPVEFPGWAGSATAIRVGDYVVAPDGTAEPPASVIPLGHPITMLDPAHGSATADITTTMTPPGKETTMTNLPPGVTHADIDRAAGADASEHWPGYLECDHSGAAADIGWALEVYDNIPSEYAEVLAAKVTALFEKAATTFEDHEVGELSVWGAGGYELTARWRCPVCGTEHETTDEFGPDPD